MQKLFSRCRTFGTAAIAALTLGAVAIPATAGTLYQWRTEEGSLAFADSIKKVPTRYQAEMTTRKMASLSSYDRFTPVDSAVNTRYEDELKARLEVLRARNARIASATPRPSVQQAPNSILFRTGSESSPSIQITPERGNGPIVMEKVQTRARDGLVTRHSWLVKQGGEVIAVTIPRSRVSNPSEVLIEESLW